MLKTLTGIKLSTRQYGSSTYQSHLLLKRHETSLTIHGRSNLIMTSESEDKDLKRAIALSLQNQHGDIVQNAINLEPDARVLKCLDMSKFRPEHVHFYWSKRWTCPSV